MVEKKVEPLGFFNSFPFDHMEYIWKYLPYRDAQNLRMVHRAFNKSYHDSYNRRHIDGPICDVCITHQGYIVMKETERYISGDQIINLICRRLIIQSDYIALSELRDKIDTWSIGSIETLGSLLNNDVIEYLHSKAETMKIKSFGYNHFGVYLPKLHSVNIQWPSRIPNLNNFFEMTPNLRALQINLPKTDLMSFYKTLERYWTENIEMIVIRRAVRTPVLPGHIFQEHADFMEATRVHFGERLRIFIDLTDLKIILCLPHIRAYQFP